MGHIKRRSPGSWTLWYELPRTSDGKRRQKTVTVHGSKRDAERELRKIEHGLDTGLYAESTSITLQDYLGRWLEHAKTSVSARTYQGYESIARVHLVPALGRLRLVKLNPLDIEGFYQGLLLDGRTDGKGGLSPTSIRHVHTLLHRALAQAVAWRMLTTNPSDFVTPPRVERQEMLVLDEPQTALLLEYARPTRLYVPILLSVTTGMRRGEVLGLRWEDIELDQSKLAVRRSLEQVKDGLNSKSPKNGRARVVHLPQLTVAALRHQRIEQAERRLQLGPDYHDEGLMCPRKNGQPWPPNLLSRNFCDFIKRHPNLPQIRFHDLRHTYATLALAKAIHPKVVSEALGHSTIAITLDLYSHVLPSLAAEAAAIFDDILGTNS